MILPPKQKKGSHSDNNVPRKPVIVVFILYRAEELETALMEMVKQDNRRQLSARVYQNSFRMNAS